MRIVESLKGRLHLQRSFLCPVPHVLCVPHDVQEPVFFPRRPPPLSLTPWTDAKHYKRTQRVGYTPCGESSKKLFSNFPTLNQFPLTFHSIRNHARTHAHQVEGTAEGVEEKRKQMAYKDAQSLSYSFKNLKRIDYLAPFQSLTKLQLDNNVISTAGHCTS